MLVHLKGIRIRNVARLTPARAVLFHELSFNSRTLPGFENFKYFLDAVWLDCHQGHHIDRSCALVLVEGCFMDDNFPECFSAFRRRDAV